MDDLYAFPADHVGRKSYVSVRGHSRSVPKFKTYRGADGYNYLRPEFGGDWSGLGGPTITVMPESAGYRSPIDGQYYEGRAAHREHLALHDVYEAGDIKFGDIARNRTELSPMPNMRDSIRQAFSQVNLRS